MELPDKEPFNVDLVIRLNEIIFSKEKEEKWISIRIDLYLNSEN